MDGNKLNVNGFYSLSLTVLFCGFWARSRKKGFHAVEGDISTIGSSAPSTQSNSLSSSYAGKTLAFARYIRHESRKMTHPPSSLRTNIKHISLDDAGTKPSQSELTAVDVSLLLTARLTSDWQRIMRFIQRFIYSVLVVLWPETNVKDDLNDAAIAGLRGP